MLTEEELPDCPVATTVQLIGGKWKLLILRNLLQRPWRFNELKKSLEGISRKVLTDSLRSMEADGIISRTVFPEVAAARGVRFNSVGTIHAPYHQSDGRLGDKLQTALVRQKGGYGSCRETVSAFMLRNSGLLSLWHMRIAPGVHAATPYIFARAGRALLFPNMSREYAFTAQNAGKACKRKIALIRLEPEAVCSFRRRIRQAAKFSRQPDLRPAVACIHVRFSCLADVPIALAACPNAFQEESVRRVFTAAAARKR